MGPDPNFLDDHKMHIQKTRRLAVLLPALLATLLVTMAMSLPAFADTLVFGGTRGIGLETVRQLRDNGEAVTVLVRKSSDLTALNEIDGVKTTVGDALEMDSITRAYASGTFDTVISTLGGTPAAGYEVDSVGNINAIDGAKAAGVERFILITSIGTGDSRAVAPPAMLKALGGVLAGKELAERHLIDSGLSWTIIRPGVLTKKPASGLGVLVSDSATMGLIGRAEIARLIIESVGNESTFSRIYSAVEKKN